MVADEIQLIGDPQRGPTLEIVLTRLKEMNPRLRFLCLSATVKNAKDIAQWLDATLISSDWRSVPLKEGVYFNGTIMFNKRKTGLEILDIAVETIEENCQVLIFVNTRRAAKSLAEKAERILSNEKTRMDIEPKGNLEALISLSDKIFYTREPTRLFKKLAMVIKEGVAFHCAGLLSEHRQLIENAFRENTIKLLISTTTLAMGLNLPSRRVIIKN